jgi:hypothetical protein
LKALKHTAKLKQILRIFAISLKRLIDVICYLQIEKSLLALHVGWALPKFLSIIILQLGFSGKPMSQKHLALDC